MAFYWTHFAVARFASVVLSVLVLAPGAAEARHDGVRIGRPFNGMRVTELNLHAGVAHRGLGPAAGFRLAVPIVDNGFVSSINNAIYISFGADLFFERCIGGCGNNDDRYGVAVAIPITGRWQFNFTPRWSAYGELGPNIYLHTGWLGEGAFPGIGRTAAAWFVGTVGGKWHFAPNTSLTLALGAPYSHVGIDMVM